MHSVSSEIHYAVRRAGAADLDAVLDVLAESGATRSSETAEQRPASEMQRATWGRMMRTADLSVYLAEQSAVPVGTAAMLVMPHLTYDCHPTAFIEAVVVKYAHRRRGVARQLLDRALGDARKADCLKVQLLSHKRHASDGALRLYEAAGFAAEAEGLRLYLAPWPPGGT